jgi:hypothetical protein
MDPMEGLTKLVRKVVFINKVSSYDPPLGRERRRIFNTFYLGNSKYW